jgi:hypothetical protein
MAAALQTAVGASDHVLAAYQLGVANNTLCDDLRSLDKVARGMSHHPGMRIFLRQLDGLPHFVVGLDRTLLASIDDLHACAAIVTRGSIDTAVPFSPATLEITPGLAPNTIGIQERNLLFFGGNLMNEAFHAAVVC